MDRKTWNLLRAAACMPLAIAATQINAQPQLPAAHAGQEAGTWTFHHEHVLGTSLEIKVRAASLTQARRAEAAALAEIDRQDRILSAWRADSELSRWSATRFQPIGVSSDLFDVLAAFDRWREQTSGALDPSAEAAIRLWRQALAEGRKPSDAEIAQTVEAIAQPHWQLDPAHHTATRLTDVPLALASFAKSHISSSAADAAMQAGATGILLNIGGDIVVRGALQQIVEIADPRASAENDAPLDRLIVRNRAVATSGSYRRGIDLASAASLQAPEFSHIVDPRTAQPTGHILSSTVIAPDAETAGALATAFSVLNPEDSASLAARTPGIDYLLVAQDGREIRSSNWNKYQLPGLRPVAYVPAPVAHAADGLWNPDFELALNLELPRIDDARYRRPYVAVWIEDADHFPLRTLALWTQNPRWLPELKQWYRDDQVRNLSEGTDISKTISSATRPPGHYSLKWDGKDNEGKPVKAGKYTVVVEASREHGSYQIQRYEMNFAAQPQQATLPTGKELGTVALDYRKR
jgi:thiamine biosynthesis lipoprotein ApbE